MLVYLDAELFRLKQPGTAEALQRQHLEHSAEVPG